MKKNIIFILFLTIFFTNIEQVYSHCETHIKESLKREYKMDEYLDSRLHFTLEQKDFIKQNRVVYKKDMEKIVKQMQKLHDEIRDVYIIGIPKYQADFRTASKKAQLIVLKQNAKKLRQEHRKTFESILSDEQKAEFEKIKIEFSKKKSGVSR